MTISKIQLVHRGAPVSLLPCLLHFAEEQREQLSRLAAFSAAWHCSAKDQESQHFETFTWHIREAKLITQHKPENTSWRFADDDMLRETGIRTITEENGSL